MGTGGFFQKVLTKHILFNGCRELREEPIDAACTTGGTTRGFRTATIEFLMGGYSAGLLACIPFFWRTFDGCVMRLLRLA